MSAAHPFGFLDEHAKKVGGGDQLVGIPALVLGQEAKEGSIAHRLA